MKYKQYPPELWTAVETAIEKAIALDPHPVAAFDADGTLWDTDLGEAFFRHKIDRRLVPLPDDAWNYYVQLKEKDGDPREAYLWLAQIMKDVPLKTVREWAEDAVIANHPLAVFPEQKKLVELLLSKGVRVRIVTASVKWAVEPGARLLGLTDDDVIGIETFVENGIITEMRKGLITYRQGKAEAVLAATGGKAPFLCSGNTMGDLELLEAATDVRLAVSAAARDDVLFKTENELQKTARARGWFAHRFIEGN